MVVFTINTISARRQPAALFCLPIFHTKSTPRALPAPPKAKPHVCEIRRLSPKIIVDKYTCLLGNPRPHGDLYVRFIFDFLSVYLTNLDAEEFSVHIVSGRNPRTVLVSSLNTGRRSTQTTRGLWISRGKAVSRVLLIFYAAGF